MKSLLTIKSASQSYAVEECESFAEALILVSSENTFVLIDQFIFDHYQADIQRAGLGLNCYPLVATEEQKSFEKLTPILVWLLQKGLKRDGLLLIIGGGVVQDIGCFIASILFRGLRWELIPTTLLAQCDSCVGSKSSINLQTYKNQIGTFYPPIRVLLVNALLQTLPWDEVRSGMGEVIKLHLIAGEEKWAWLRKQLPLVKENRALLRDCVQSSLRIKQPFIEQDEYDRGIRNLLNYGHTFGHAYESATHYVIPHGIAVILGLLTATYLSAKRNDVTMAYFEDLKELLSPWYQPYEKELKAISIETIFAAIKLDKKNSQSSIYCILSRGAGRMEKVRVENGDEFKIHVRDLIQFLNS